MVQRERMPIEISLSRQGGSTLPRPCLPGRGRAGAPAADSGTRSAAGTPAVSLRIGRRSGALWFSLCSRPCRSDHPRNQARLSAPTTRQPASRMNLPIPRHRLGARLFRSRSEAQRARILWPDSPLPPLCPRRASRNFRSPCKRYRPDPLPLLEDFDLPHLLFSRAPSPANGSPAAGTQGGRTRTGGARLSAICWAAADP
mmetsp:Transcript_5750/g.14334  ORF Transcript_5750/g.14334 Transcript_5750/m.14334 type:complete len:200 (-) Transcript_5750:201-800(-)